MWTVAAFGTSGCAGAVISPADANADDHGHQVGLDPGVNTVTVAATAAGATTTYTVSITRAAAPEDEDEDEDPQTDLDPIIDKQIALVTPSFNLVPANDSPYGLVGDADGGVLWVHDYADDQLYAYQLSDGARVADKDSTLARDSSQNSSTGRGVCFDGTTLWRNTFTIEPDASTYASVRSLLAHSGFNAASPPDALARDDDRDIDLLDLYYARSLRDKSEGVHGTGVWCDSELMLTLFTGDEQFFARVDLTGTSDSVVIPVDLGGADRRPVDLWSDGDTVWILHEAADGTDSRIGAYGVRDGRQRSKVDIDARGLGESAGATSIWSDGESMWIVGGESTADSGGSVWSLPMPDPTSGPPEPWSAWENMGNQVWVRFSEPLAGSGPRGRFSVYARQHNRYQPGRSR